MAYENSKEGNVIIADDFPRMREHRFQVNLIHARSHCITQLRNDVKMILDSSDRPCLRLTHNSQCDYRDNQDRDNVRF
jgi:hypothetical protein